MGTDRRTPAVLLVSVLVLLSVPATATTGAIPATADPAAVGAEERPAAAGTPATVDPALQQANGTTEVVVRFDEAALPNERAQERASAQAKQALESHARQTQGSVVRFAKRTDGVEVRERLWLANAMLLEVDRDEVDLGTVAALDGVRRLHPNFEVRVPEPSTAGDATASASDDDYNTTYGLDQVNATEVWDAYGTRGGGVKVAVLDTGVDPDHPDIDLHTEDPSNETHPGGWAEFDEDGNRVPGSVPHDTGRHGTHTSGTVSGGDASGEYVGVAPDVELMHGLVLPDGEGTFTQIIAGMEWAVENDADVISMSLGGKGYYDTMIEPVRNAESAGVVVVASSGNSGEGVTGTPGNVYDTIAVGATDEDRRVASFSSGEEINTSAAWGSDAPGEWPDSYVVPDVTAPGVAVKSTVPGGDYERLSGTSMAAPHTAGTVALLLGAAGGDASVGELKSVLSRTAVKPDDCQPDCTPRDGNDTRYGAGVVDAMAAAELVAADAGVTGTVTDANGTPVRGATVALDTGVSTTTDANGEYTLRATPGEYTVTAEGPFGYADDSATVTVTEGSFADANFTLADRLDARVAADQPDGVQAGDAASTTLRVANLDSYAVELAGDYDAANATLTVNGVERSFGESISFEDYAGEVTATVETDADATGAFSLRHELDGPGDSASLSTGPTTVYADEVRVAVVDSATGLQYGPDVADALDAELPVNFRVSVVNGTDAAVEAVGEYDVFAVQNVSDDRESMAAFVEATESGDVGVVYLNQYGPVSNAVTKLSEVTGNPRVLHEQARFYNYNDVFYQVTADHPVVDGVGEPGDNVVLQEIGYFDWFQEYDGSRRLAHAGYVTCGFFGCSEVPIKESTALAVDEASRTVLASSLGRVPVVGNDEYLDPADAALANAVTWASDDPPATVADGQPRTVRPGEAVTATLDVSNLTEATVSVDDEFSTLSADELTLYVNGDERAFGSPVSYDGLTSDDVTVRVVPEANATGSVSLDYAFVADGETVTGSTGPTTVYEPPLTVPGDAATVQEAVNVAPAGATIVVGDGEYGPVNVRDAENHDLTIRGAPDADPTITAPEGRGNRAPAVRVAADNVTIESLDLDVPVDSDNGVSVTEAENVSVVGVNVTGGEAGVAVGSGFSTAPSTTVRNVTVTGAKTGVLVYKSPGSTVTESTVRDAGDRGVRLWYANHTTVRNNHVSGSPVGVDVRAWNYGATVADNTVTDVETGVHVNPISTGKRIVGNDVTADRVGILVEGRTEGWSAETDVRRNRVDAETGLEVAATADAVHVRYNDLRSTDVAVRHKGREPVDARLNYLGDRGPTNTSVSGAVYDPFLTAPPEAVDAGNATRIATDLTLSGGEANALGVPGPTNQSIRDVLGDGFEGDVYRYNPNAGKWQPVTGEGRLAAVEALDAFKVVPENDTRAVVSFRDDSTPPAKGHGSGPPARSPGEVTLVRGWNFVAAPAYAPVEDAFADATADVTRVEPAFAQPGSQLGPPGDLDGVHRVGDDSGANVSAFAGYLVYAEDRGTLQAAVPANPTASDLYANLSLAADLAADDVAPTGDASATVEETVTVGDATVTRVTVVGDAYTTVLEAENATASGNETAAIRSGPAATP